VRFWKRLPKLSSQIGHENSNTIKQILLSKIEIGHETVRKNLDHLGILNAPWRGEIAISIANKDKQRAVELIDSLRITDHSHIEKLINYQASADKKVLSEWLQGFATSAPTSLEPILKRAKILVNPWAALKNLKSSAAVDQTLYSETLVICAAENTAEFIRQLPILSVESMQLRKRLFEVCAERRIWYTFEHVREFGLNEVDLENQVKKAFATNPLMAIKALKRLIQGNSELVKAGFRAAIKVNASQSLELFRRYDLDEGQKVLLLQQALRRNPSLITRNKTSISNMLSVSKMPEVIASAARGNIKRTTELFSKNGYSLNTKPQFIRAAALEDLDMALKTSSKSELIELSDPNFLKQIAADGIVKGRWSSALRACRELAKNSSELIQEHDSISDVLKMLDLTIEQLGVRTDLSTGEKDNISLIKKIRQANCIPTNMVQGVFDHFGDDDFLFLISVFEQAGSSVAEGIFETLLNVYPFETDISKLDQVIIEDCIKLRFRGLSEEMLRKLRPIYERSPIKGKKVIQDFQLLTSKVFDGSPITGDMVEPELFPSLVHAAYRPVGMTTSEVKMHIRNIEDKSHHISGFAYPREGYSVSLSKGGTVELKAGMQLDHGLAERIASIIVENNSIEHPLLPQLLMKRLLEGAFDQIDQRSAWNSIKSFSADPRIAAFTAKVTRGIRPEALLRERLFCLSNSRELLSVVARDAFMEVASLNLAGEESQRFQLTTKMTAAVRRVLRMSPDNEVGKEELLTALEVQFDKLFRPIQMQIIKEARKFNQTFEQIAQDRYKLFVSKNIASYFGRAGAGLCTALENWSWNNQNFLQMVMVDSEKLQVVGNIQLHLFQNKQGQPAILARLNPTSVFLNSVSFSVLAREMLRVVQQFADDNKLVPYIPVQTGWHELTNRDPFAPALEAYGGDLESSSIQITGTYTVRQIQRLKRINLQSELK
jgi:hypothetical protein